MSSGFVCVIKRLVILRGSLSKPWYVMATNGEFQADSLHPPAGRDGQGVVRQLAVRREQLEVLSCARTGASSSNGYRWVSGTSSVPRRMPHGHRNEHHLLFLQHGEDGIRIKAALARPGPVACVVFEAQFPM